MDNNIKENRKNSIKRLFSTLFLRNGYGLSDYFDYNVWFLKNIFYPENESNGAVKEFISTSTSENDDVIKFLIVRRFLLSKNLIEYKIKVEDFLNEVTDYLLSLHEENKRVDNLIKLYDAFKTKNYIEQILENSEKLFRHQEIFKSNIKISIEEIENVQKGDFKISLLTSFIKDRINCFNYKESEPKEELLEFKLSSILTIKENNYFKSESLNEYIFPQIDFYSHEMKNNIYKFDSGTNLLFFQLKIENLNSANSEGEILYSEKNYIIELFLSNLETLLNVSKKNKTLQMEMKIKNNNSEYKFKLRLNLLFDPWTLISIYKKIFTLLQTTISFKVLTEHKWNTILYYFEDISKEVIEVFDDEKLNKMSNCVIF